MKTHETSSSIFLTGTILFANLDFNGMFEYALKAFIGGAIWLGYKVAADYIERKKRKQLWASQTKSWPLPLLVAG